MIKVCHMTSAHGPEDVRIFHKECVSLAKAGYDVYLVERGESYEKNGVHIVGVGQPSGGRLSRMTKFAKRVYQKALALDADIYHFHDPELLPFGLKLKRQGKKVIFDSHEKYTEQLKNKPYLPSWCTIPIAYVYGFYEKYCLKRLDAVIFPCLMDGKNPFENLCRRVVIVNNFPHLEELYDCYDAKAEKHPRSVCYIGGLSEARGITVDIRAAFEADAILELAGEFATEEYAARLRAMPEYSCVQYLGTLDRPQVVDTLQHCMIGIATLLNVGQYHCLDNLPTKAYEYMSLGLPVILSDSAFNGRMIDQYHFGLCVDPENVNEIASAICYLLENPEKARQIGMNGRRAVEEEFNWRVEEKKLVALYQVLIDMN